jgi:hypothetical protein
VCTCVCVRVCVCVPVYIYMICRKHWLIATYVSQVALFSGDVRARAMGCGTNDGYRCRWAPPGRDLVGFESHEQVRPGKLQEVLVSAGDDIVARTLMLLCNGGVRACVRLCSYVWDGWVHMNRKLSSVLVVWSVAHQHPLLLHVHLCVLRQPCLTLI